MLHRVILLGLLFFNFILTVNAQAVTFKGEFLDPPQFWDKVHANPDNPINGYEKNLRRALDGVILVGGRATAVIISKTGLAITAQHVIADLYTQPTKDCSRVPLFMKHELNSDGAMDSELERLTCDEILVNEYSDDFVLMKLKPRKNGQPFPFAKIVTRPEKITVGMKAMVVGHPHALNYGKGVKKISAGPIVFYAPEHPELPHFLHLIDTEGGNSGAPVMLADGTVIGLHFRGVPQYGDGVEVLIDGEKQIIHKFNVALPLPYLFHKYKKAFH